MNIYNLPPEDIKSISENLEKAKFNHLQWLNLLNEYLVSRSEENGDSFGEDHSCSFSEWYVSVKEKGLSSDEFVVVEEKHKQIHEQANILVRKQAEGKAITVDEYRIFTSTEENFINALDSLYSSVVSVRYGIDHLTNLPNRGLLQLILEKEHAVFERDLGDCCIAIADIDFFKKVNNQYGHIAGDEVLKAISELFSASLRKYDSVGRYGGEEFIFCLPNTGTEEAKAILERMRKEIQETKFIVEEYEITISCSFGLSKFKESYSLSHTIAEADKALFMAKERGRNQVYISEDNGDSLSAI